MVIDFADLQKLSGRKHKKLVVAWLKRANIKFVIGDDGRPRTTHDLLEASIKDRRHGKAQSSEVRFI
jgi:hypothetical protein